MPQQAIVRVVSHQSPYAIFRYCKFITILWLVAVDVQCFLLPGTQ